MKRGMLTAMLMMSTLGVNGSTYPFKTGSGMNPNYRRSEKKKQEKEFCIKGIKVMAYSRKDAIKRLGKHTSCNRKRSSVPREQVLERIYFKMKMKNHSICHNIMLHFSLKILFDILYCDKSIKSLLLINTLSLSPIQMLKSKIHILDLKITLF